MDARWTVEQTRRLQAIMDELYPQCGPATRVSWPTVAKRMGDRSATQCSQKWKRSLQPGLQLGHWSTADAAALVEMVSSMNATIDWSHIAEKLGRTVKQCKDRFYELSDPTIVVTKSVPLTSYEQDLLRTCYDVWGTSWAQVTDEFNRRLLEDADTMAALRTEILDPALIPRRSIVDLKRAIQAEPYYCPSVRIGRKKRIRQDSAGENASAVRRRVPDSVKAAAVVVSPTAPPIAVTELQHKAIDALCALGISAAEARAITTNASKIVSAKMTSSPAMFPEPSTFDMDMLAECSIETTMSPLVDIDALLQMHSAPSSPMRPRLDSLLDSSSINSLDEWPSTPTDSMSPPAVSVPITVELGDSVGIYDPQARTDAAQNDGWSIHDFDVVDACSVLEPPTPTSDEMTRDSNIVLSLSPAAGHLYLDLGIHT
ncbi:hypothetical protein ACHHYP_08693 [Achlya hypogyna]|uniref:Myb-like DNA-binding protein n=1 Tax=Achlya hypogyna TaxID=1202772 RepID=A0A1V9YPB0_ACHHY|nr:hypothetical protein ACHHYP_08693 [Achlya hypogyna]